MSAILSANDLNDFISPGVACIKPVETLLAAERVLNESDVVDTGVILDGQRKTHAATGTAAPAQVSLTDCLACSGCVTSAEAVLVSLQSHAEVLSKLDAAPALRVREEEGTSDRFCVEGLEKDESRIFVASVSPQTRANLAAACGGHVTEREAGRMLQHLLRGPAGLARGGQWQNGFAWVVDTNAAREATLVLSAEEVTGSSPSHAAPPSRPVLASSCPGWVCYAEKTHPHVLPHLSKVKSPQAWMGTLLKTVLSRRLGIPPSKIWHLAVMPCFDKKLEASREEFTDQVWSDASQPGRGVRDVDCVITSKEILMLAESRNINFFDLPRDLASLPSMMPFPDRRLHEFLFSWEGRHTKPHPSAGSSGGFLHYILRRKVAENPNSDIQISRGRNADVTEYSVVLDGRPIFRAARYYGFRNIQNLVRKLKPVKPSRIPGGKPFGAARRPVANAQAPEHAYVEVMACPGGCTNGGGQLKLDDPVLLERRHIEHKPGLAEQKKWLAEVDEAYFSNDEGGTHGDWESGDGDGMTSSYIFDTLAYWCEMTGVSLNRLAMTSFREVMSDVGKDQSTDAEKVVQLAGKIGGGW